MSVTIPSLVTNKGRSPLHSKHQSCGNDNDDRLQDHSSPLLPANGKLTRTPESCHWYLFESLRSNLTSWMSQNHISTHYGYYDQQKQRILLTCDEDITQTQNGNIGGGGYITGVVEFATTPKALHICVTSIVVLLAISIVFFAFLLPDHWTIIDCMYFAVVTFTTVGYGDFHPTAYLDQIFTCMFIICGVMVMGVVLGIIGQNLVLANEKIVRNRKKGTERTFMLNFLTKDKQCTTTTRRNQHQNHINKTNGNNSLMVSNSVKSLASISSHLVVSSTTNDDEDYDRDCYLWPDVLKVCKRTCPLFLLLLTCGLLIGYFEHWDLQTTLYYTIVTMTTVGYGDVTPNTQSMRLFAVLFIPLSVAVMANFLGTVAGIYMERKVRDTEREFLQRHMTEEDFEYMDSNKDGIVKYGEFLSFMLVALRKVEKHDLIMLRRLYDSLDADQKGALKKEDLIHLTNVRRSISTSIGGKQCHYDSCYPKASDSGGAEV